MEPQIFSRFEDKFFVVVKGLRALLQAVWPRFDPRPVQMLEPTPSVLGFSEFFENQFPSSRVAGFACGQIPAWGKLRLLLLPKHVIFSFYTRQSQLLPGLT